MPTPTFSVNMTAPSSSQNISNAENTQPAQLSAARMAAVMRRQRWQDFSFTS
jgi:hypothetical protein